MTDIQSLQKRIEEAIAAIAYPQQPEGLYEPIAYTLSAGGKRIRPVLLLLAYGIYRPDVEKALPMALALETYHNHTLLHDDLMDGASLRRGKPTVHCKWNDNTAILSGDAMLICAVQTALRTEGCNKEKAMALFAETMKEICEGQQYDVNFETRTDVSEQEYVEMIRLKTSVLLAAAAKIGALLADAPEADADALYGFAQNIGLAFQLQDDLLDVYGDPAVFGKKIGGDIRQGKKTYLLIKAFNKADNNLKNKIIELLSSSNDEEKVKGVTAIYDELGIRALCEKKIEDFYAAAFAELERLSVSHESTKGLRTFATNLLGRQS